LPEQPDADEMQETHPEESALTRAGMDAATVGSKC